MTDDNIKIIDADFLNGFLKEDMANALLIYYQFEEGRPGGKAEAAAIVEITKEAYPNSTISQVLDYKLSQGSEWAGRLLVVNALHNSDRFLIKTAMDSSQKAVQWLHPENLNLLKK